MRPVIRKQRGKGKPETFTFLGFTHYCGQRHKTETFTVWRITAKRGWLRSSKPSRLSFNAGSMIAPVRSVHGFGRWSSATTNIMLFPATSISCPSSKLRQPTVAKRPGSPQSTREGRSGGVCPSLRQVDSTTPCPASLSRSPLLRHSSFIRAVCVDAPVRICAGGAQ